MKYLAGLGGIFCACSSVAFAEVDSEDAERPFELCIVEHRSVRIHECVSVRIHERVSVHVRTSECARLRRAVPARYSTIVRVLYQ